MSDPLNQSGAPDDVLLDPISEVDSGQPATAKPLNVVNRNFGRNVAWTIVARMVNMARGVCVVPFLLRHLGLETYGIWTTIFLLVIYVGITTLGISNVYIKYVAEFHARREYDKANQLVSTGLAVTIPVCAALFFCFWLGWDWVAPYLHLPPGHAADGKEAVLIVLAVFLSSIALNAFGDMLTGTQQIASTQIFLSISIIVEFVFIVWLVLIGRGIRGLAEAYLIRTVLNDGLTIWWARRKLTWLHLSIRSVRREALNHVIHFGGIVQFQSILAQVLSSIERVCGLTLIGAAAAGLLDVARKWPSSVQSIPMAFFGAMLPAASHIDAASSREERLGNLRTLYLSGSRYSNLSTSIFVGAMVFWSAPILFIWLGSALPMRDTLIPLFVVFSLATQFHMLTGPGTSVLRGMGKVYEEFNYSIPNVVLLVITLLVARWVEGGWTVLGIGLAVSAATVGSACILMARVHYVLELPLRRFLGTVIAPGLAPYLAAALLAWPLAMAASAVNRWQAAAVLLVASILYVAIVVTLLFRWGMTPAERKLGTEALRRLTARFKPQGDVPV